MIKSKFSIKDLENLSGIKSHTIRIWEKRYNLFEPERTDTNIRTYNLKSLRKILNVKYLKNDGIKISTIAGLSTEEIESQVRLLSRKKNKNNHSVQELKLAMVNFDQFLFQRVYDAKLEELGFSGVFYELFVPFLEELGFLWQSKTINIAHEHFISHLIKQKVLINLEKVQYDTPNYFDDEVYVLFLPENEMHDLGLLFLNYELLKRGCKTIYLGASMVLDALPYFNKNGARVTFITYITVQPIEKDLPAFLKKFDRQVAKNGQANLWILGHLAQRIKNRDLLKNQTVFRGISEVIDSLPELVEI